VTSGTGVSWATSLPETSGHLLLYEKATAARRPTIEAPAEPTAGMAIEAPAEPTAGMAKAGGKKRRKKKERRIAPVLLDDSERLSLCLCVQTRINMAGGCGR
jgi:hypothetical protein